MKIYAALAMMMALACPAQAVEKDGPQAFRGETGGGLMLCRLSAKLAVLKIGRGDSTGLKDVAECQTKARDAAKISFKPLIASYKKKPEAAKILKEYYASWMTSLGNIVPSADERQILYEQRQITEDANLDKLWNQFVVEAEI